MVYISMCMHICLTTICIFGNSCGGVFMSYHDQMFLFIIYTLYIVYIYIYYKKCMSVEYLPIKGDHVRCGS